MMTQVLLISVHLHEGRYHGMGEVLPAPARLFQAMVAGAGISGAIANECNYRTRMARKARPACYRSTANVGRPIDHELRSKQRSGHRRRRSSTHRFGEDVQSDQAQAL